MDVLNIERAFTAWIASKLGLVVDTGIFRGAIPDGFPSGVAVRFDSEIKTNQGFYGFRPRTYIAQIAYKADDRDSTLIMLSKLNGIFPCYDFTQNNVRFLSAVPQGATEPYEVEDNGVVKNYISFNATIQVLTTGSQL